MRSVPVQSLDDSDESVTGKGSWLIILGNTIKVCTPIRPTNKKVVESVGNSVMHIKGQTQRRLVRVNW